MRVVVLSFSEILHVKRFRLEKWEKGTRPNYEDGSKINAYFGVRDFNNFSEEFLKNFNSSKKGEDVLTLKDQLLEEKDKRIESLEQTINLLKEALGAYEKKKKG